VYLSSRLDTPIDIFRDDIFRSEIFDRAISYVLHNSRQDYRPSLYEALIANDFDLVPWNTKTAEAMFHHGYRHGALYFFEVHICVSIALLAAILECWILWPWTMLHLFTGLMELFLYMLFPSSWLYVLVTLPLWLPIFALLLLWYTFATTQATFFLGEILVVRPFVRYKNGMFLMTMRREDPWLAYTRQDYQNALVESVFELLGVVGSTVSHVLRYLKYVQAHSPTCTAGQECTNAFISESRGRCTSRRIVMTVVDPETRQEHSQQELLGEERSSQGEETHRHEQFWRVCKSVARWTYQRVLRPSFNYTVIKPTQWTIQLAQWEANVARRTAQGRAKRARDLAETDADLGDYELFIQE
jgi:hypothetical protein